MTHIIREYVFYTNTLYHSTSSLTLKLCRTVMSLCRTAVKHNLGSQCFDADTFISAARSCKRYYLKFALYGFVFQQLHLPGHRLAILLLPHLNPLHHIGIRHYCFGRYRANRLRSGYPIPAGKNDTILNYHYQSFQ